MPDTIIVKKNEEPSEKNVPECPKGTKYEGGVCKSDMRYVYDPDKMNPNSYEPFFYIPSVNLKVSLRINYDPRKHEISVTNIAIKPYRIK